MKTYICCECGEYSNTSYECFIHFLLEGDGEFINLESSALYYPIKQYTRRLSNGEN